MALSNANDLWDFLSCDFLKQIESYYDASLSINAVEVWIFEMVSMFDF